MLDLALQACLPLIAVETEDTVHVHEVLSYLSGGETFVEIEHSHIGKLENPGFSSGEIYFYLNAPEGVNYSVVYEALVKTNRTLVVINPQDKDALMFDTGELRVPKELLEQFLDTLVQKEDLDQLVAVLGGLTLKDVNEIIRLTTTRYEELTPRGVMSIRRQYVGRLKGVGQVDTSYPYYDPPGFITDWLKVDGELFGYEDVPHELIPRGLLFGGGPGTGKTMGAKYIANELGVPLYRLDLGGLMGKYVGESESNLNQALAIADQSEPCVLLLDEIEKIFSGNDDNGVSSRMLSALLWWLQEHRSKVFTILTTNNSSALPKELYRPGRIDKVYTFKGLAHKAEKWEFIKNVLNALDIELNYEKVLHKISINDTEVDSQANLTQKVYTAVKKWLVS